MLWSYYLLSVRVVSIQSSELQLGVSEQDEKMRTVASLNLLHHSHACVFIHLNIMGMFNEWHCLGLHAALHHTHLPRQHHVLHRVEDDGPVGLAHGLAVQPGGTCREYSYSIHCNFSKSRPNFVIVQ